MARSTYWLRLFVLTIFSTISGSLRGQSWQWALTPQTTSTGSSIISATARDEAGGYIVAGTFTGTVTFGTTTLTSTGVSDVFVARVDDAGNWTQAVRAGGTGGARPRTMAVSTAGTVVLAGDFSGSTATFGSFSLAKAGTVATTTDVFVAWLSPAGIWTQAVRGGGVGSEIIRSVATDVSGNVVIGGTIHDSPSRFGAFTLTPVLGPDIFVARVSAAGIWTQAVSVGNSGGDLLHALVLEPNGTVHITGFFTSYSLDFGAFTLNNSSIGAGTYYTLYVATLNSAGTWTRAIRVLVTGNVTPRAMIEDGPGNLVLTGTFDARMASFGRHTLYNANTTNVGMGGDIFVARLNSISNWTQAVSAGGLSEDAPLALAQDNQGNIVVGGYYRATTMFGAISLANADQPVTSPLNTTTDVFVARLNRAGTWTHAIRAGGAGMDQAEGLSIDETAGVLGLSPATVKRDWVAARAWLNRELAS